jgi:16S rRNA (guanine966-N2)-methyltransferase
MVSKVPGTAEGIAAVRIVAGEFRSRRLVAPAGTDTRPTSDRAREALFAMLGDVTGVRALDLFAGSGALGLEALSRGAASADFVELNPPSLRALEANIAALGVDGQARIHRGDALRFAEHLPAGAYDVAFADPPYNRDDAVRLVALFRRTPFARILSVEHRAAERLEGDSTRRYGDTALTFCHAP